MDLGFCVVRYVLFALRCGKFDFLDGSSSAATKAETSEKRRYFYMHEESLRVVHKNNKKKSISVCCVEIAINE